MKAYKAIVPFKTAQIPNVLFCTGWTNHQIIMNRYKTDGERLFYLCGINAVFFQLFTLALSICITVGFGEWILKV